jgi:hypothetical protein
MAKTNIFDRLRGILSSSSEAKDNSVEGQIKVLDKCGIRLRPGVDVEKLLESFGREAYEADPYKLLLVSMGSELEFEPFENASDDVWHFDTECIEDHNDYIRIAERFRDLAGGLLPLENITDNVDLLEGEVWLSFHLDGHVHKWTAEVDNDWVDTKIISRFAELLTGRNLGKRFTYLDLGGQDCIIGLSSSEQLQELKTRTGLKFQWLT